MKSRFESMSLSTERRVARIATRDQIGHQIIQFIRVHHHDGSRWHESVTHTGGCRLPVSGSTTRSPAIVALDNMTKRFAKSLSEMVR